MQQNRSAARRVCLVLCATVAAQSTRRTGEYALEGLVEAPHASKSGRQSNVGDRQPRLVE